MSESADDSVNDGLSGTLADTLAGIRVGEPIADAWFDQLYPEPVRSLSARHWTPIDVARQAAMLLNARPSTRVLDVGSGPGKFCLIASLVSPATFVGIEQRANLVEIARSVAERCGAGRAIYRHVEMRSVDWREFDAFYFFNPFAENRFEPDERIDHDVILNAQRHHDDVGFVKDQLSQSRVGTRVVTYHGFGGEMPPGFELVSREYCGTDWVDLWLKIAL